MEKNAANYRQELKKYGVFYTPLEVAEIMKKYIPFEVEEVYDPTIGQGNLLKVFDDDVKKYGQEFFQEELDKCSSVLKNFTGVRGDTLKEPGFKDRKFQTIMSNPPYSVAWEPAMDERFEKCGVLAPKSKADLAFVLHCLHYLKDDGIAVLLVFPGILYRGNAEQKIRKWLIENNYIDRVVLVPGDKFVDTKIATNIIVLKKNKTTTDVVFENLEHELEKTVSFEEIEKNKFNLSVNTYIEEPREEIKIDIDELNKTARKGSLRKIEANIGFEAQILNFTNDSEAYLKFLDDIIEICNKYKKEFLEGEKKECTL